MKYLTEYYWEDFKKVVKTKNGENKIIQDGKKFESLIEMLLKLLYGNENVNWEKTKDTHDGNKDFLGKRSDGTYIWAECKNYKEKISLKVIAPTLVMAEINDIHDILIFSYSALNQNTKNKLLYYADKRNKKLYYYDDLNLENLLFRFRTKIFPQFFPKYKEITQYPEKIEPYIFSYSMPGLSYNDNIEFSSSEFSIKLNELFFIGIGIINNNYSEKIDIELSFGQDNDLAYLEIVDSSIQLTDYHKWKKQVTLEPGEAIFFRMYFKIVRYKKEINMPSVKLEILNSTYSTNTIIFKRITCNSLFNVPVIGDEYLNFIQKLKFYTINQGRMSVGFLYGKSGVGKSRLLQESQSIYISNHYQILNFTLNVSSKDSLHIIREIIYFIYNLTPELVIESLREYQKEKSLFKSEHMEIVNLLPSLIEKDLKIFISKLQAYKYLIFEKILSQKNAFIIDNIQFADTFLADFFYDLCVYAKNKQKNTNFVIVFSCNEDYYCNSAVKKLRLLLEELNKQTYLSIVLHKVNGMQKNNLALGFVKQLIHVRDENCDFYLNKIIEKANYIPKHIENIVQYLSSEQILDSEENYLIIKDLQKFYNVIDDMPNEFSDVFQKRFHLFLEREYPLDEKAVLLVISAIHFLGNVAKEQLNQLKLNVNILEKLDEYGFVNKNYVGEYWFEHDLYEQFFATKFLLEENFLAYIIKGKIYDNYIFKPWQKILILVKENLDPQKNVQQIILIGEDILESIPYKIKKYFYRQIILYMSLHTKEKINFDKYMECLTKICLSAKNNLGIIFSNSLFEMIYNAIQDIDFKQDSDGYRNFLYEYSENLLQGGDNKVIRIYKQQLNYLKQNSEKNYKYIARFYNRIYVYYKAKKDEKSVHKYFKNSMKLCHQKNLLGLEIENLYDEGNYYLFDKNKRENLIECWSKGYSLFDKNKEDLEYLTLNSLKKKIQLDLIMNNYSEIDDIFEHAFEYLEFGKYNQQELFFYASLYYLKAIYGLISSKFENDEIYEFINKAGKYYTLINDKKPYSVHFLYAKLAYKEGEYIKMISFYNNALQMLNKRQCYYNDIKKIILNDFCYKIASLKQEKLCRDIRKENLSNELIVSYNSILNMNNEEIQNFKNSFLNGSVLTDKTGKDGYVF